MSFITYFISAVLLVLMLISPAAAVHRSHPLRKSSVSPRRPVSSLFQPIPIPLPSVPPPLRSASSFSSSASSNSTISFNETLSMRLLVHSSAAYSTTPFHCLHRYYPHFQHTHTFNTTIYNTSLHGYAGIDNNTQSIIFAFQGSMDIDQLWEELLHDSPVNFTTGSGGSGLLVNQYFWMGSTALLPTVRAAYVNLTTLYTNYTVHFTGHSLGGSLAHLLSYLIQSTATIPSMPSSPQPRPLLLLYTYGQPRTGNAAFATMSGMYVPYHYRVVHWRDIIPHLPPCPTQRSGPGGAEVCSASSATAGYYAYHSLQEVWYPSAMPKLVPQQSAVPPAVWSVCVGEPVGEDEECSDGLDWYWIEDHYYYFGVEVGDFCLSSAEKQNRAAAALPATQARAVATE